MVLMQNLQDFEVANFRCTAFSSAIGTEVFHGFFGRQGGVSRDVYASLNCGRGSRDDPICVVENLGLVASHAGVAAERLLTLHQIHSPTCLVVEEAWTLEDRPQADAFVTKVAGLALGVLTADCAPVLFYGADAHGAPIVGAAHAGWGGAFGGVLEATLEQMRALGVVEESLAAVVGPCIAQPSYEVGQEFYDRFLEQDHEHECFFLPSLKDDHYMFDLTGYCQKRLRDAGVGRVSSKGLDTYFNEEDFFSYRRATHRGESDYGRQISVILIEENL